MHNLRIVHITQLMHKLRIVTSYFYITGINFIHEGHLVQAAETFKAETLDMVRSTHMFPRFPVLAYTVLANALTSVFVNSPERLQQLRRVWELLSKWDLLLTDNLALMKNVSIIVLL